METVEPGAGSELAQPLPTSSLKPPIILILTPPWVGTGALWAAKLGLFSHLLLGNYSKSGSFGGPLGVRKGGNHWPTAWPTLTQVPRHKLCPQRPVPAWTTLGREHVSKLVEKGLWAWLTSTGRPGAQHFSLPGLHPPARPRGTPRKCQLPGLGRAGPRGVEVRLGSPHQAIGARLPKTSTRPWQDFEGPFSHYSSWTHIHTHTHTLPPPPRIP